MSWDPQWQAMSHGFTIVFLRQHKLECGGNTQPLRERERERERERNQCMSFYWRSCNICILGCRRSHPRQPPATHCDDWETIRRKRPELLSRGVTYQHDDVAHHRAWRIRVIVVLSLGTSATSTPQSWPGHLGPNFFVHWSRTSPIPQNEEV